MMNTMLNTAYALLTDTVLYITAIAVLIGGIAGLLTEFGAVALINKLLSPLMRPLYGLPGASIVGVLTTYLSDNPAILTLAEDDNFCRYFKKYQLPALTNVGTAFGMGADCYNLYYRNPRCRWRIVPFVSGYRQSGSGHRQYRQHTTDAVQDEKNLRN